MLAVKEGTHQLQQGAGWPLLGFRPPTCLTGRTPLCSYTQISFGNVCCTARTGKPPPPDPSRAARRAGPNTPASPRPAADLELVQELVLMFPTLPAIHVRHAVESFATREEVIDYLLQHQGSGVTAKGPFLGGHTTKGSRPHLYIKYSGVYPPPPPPP